MNKELDGLFEIRDSRVPYRKIFDLKPEILADIDIDSELQTILQECYQFLEDEHMDTGKELLKTHIKEHSNLALFLKKIAIKS